MKIQTNVNGENVVITLTPEQLKEIAKQTAKYKIDDIDDIKDAEKVLKDCKTHTKFTEAQFTRLKDWNSYQLETIIKAANYLDNNNQEYTPDFNNTSIYKYLPYLQKSRSGWVVHCVAAYYHGSCCPLWLYFKERKTAELIVNKFLPLYNKVWG